MEYRARARAGAEAAILTSWSRSRAKMERLHNTEHRTDFNNSDPNNPLYKNSHKSLEHTVHIRFSCLFKILRRCLHSFASSLILVVFSNKKTKTGNVRGFHTFLSRSREPGTNLVPGLSRHKKNPTHTSVRKNYVVDRWTYFSRTDTITLPTTALIYSIIVQA